MITLNEAEGKALLVEKAPDHKCRWNGGVRNTHLATIIVVTDEIDVKTTG